MKSEFEFLKRLRQRVERQRHLPELRLGIGDDAAIIRGHAGRDLVVTTDLLIEDIDFRGVWMQPQLLGHKALAVSLSDVAAMGARPRWAMLSIGVPENVWRSKFVDEFYDGFFKLADEHHVTLIGGDVSKTPDRIAVDSFVIGEVQRNRAVRRTGARVGDLIFVTGHLGGAAAGLQLLENGARLTKGNEHSPGSRHQLLLRHLAPNPRIQWGIKLGERGLASAMIDLSDGLSSDLNHLCEESQVGALIDATRLPINPFIEQVRGQAFDALSLALHGGEDYELLFTVRARNASKLPKKVGGGAAVCIGRVTDRAERVCVVSEGHKQTLEPKGFVHFE